MKIHFILIVLVCIGLVAPSAAFGFKKKFGKFGGGSEFYSPVSVLPVPVPIHEHVQPQYVPLPVPIIIQQPVYSGAIATASASASASAGSSGWPSTGWPSTGWESIGWPIESTGWESSSGWGNKFPSLGVGFSKYGGFFKR